MPKYRLSGDILHPGIVEVEADSPEEAIDKAEDYGDFTIDDEQNKPLAFKFDGGAIFDENGEVEWGTTVSPESLRADRTVWRLTAADLDAIAGRTLTEDELANIEGALDSESVSEAIHDAVVLGVIG